METFIKKGEYKRLYNNTYLMVDVMDYRGCVIAKFYDTELADEYIAFKMGKNKPVEIPEISDERFKMPTDKQLVEIALLFNDGKLQKSKLRDMIAMCEFVLDRLYENNDVMKPSSKE